MFECERVGVIIIKGRGCTYFVGRMGSKQSSHHCCTIQQVIQRLNVRFLTTIRSLAAIVVVVAVAVGVYVNSNTFSTTVSVTHAGIVISLAVF